MDKSLLNRLSLAGKNSKLLAISFPLGASMGNFLPNRPPVELADETIGNKLCDIFNWPWGFIPGLPELEL